MESVIVETEPRPWVHIRGVYGGVPEDLSPAECGINAVWVGSGALTTEAADRAKAGGCALFAEFNTMHAAEYLGEDPSAAPVGPDGAVCPAPDGWQGLCPTHPGYRRRRMAAFAEALERFPLDGIWLDYHHAHASWEQAEPNLPDTCFCARCLRLFGEQTGKKAVVERLLGPLRAAWTEWRCGVFTDWVREFRQIVDRTRPGSLLGTFHCPWSATERDGALTEKLAIDLAAQAEHLDVFSPMPYHARFGHASDPSWISRQTAWLGNHLGIRGEAGERHAIWPIVQLSDWGESVPARQVWEVLDHGSRPPATGVMAFNWGGLQRQRENVVEMCRFYRAIGSQ